jgi:hypothetical protein
LQWNSCLCSLPVSLLKQCYQGWLDNHWTAEPTCSCFWIASSLFFSSWARIIPNLSFYYIHLCNRSLLLLFDFILFGFWKKKLYKIPFIYHLRYWTSANPWDSKKLIRNIDFDISNIESKKINISIYRLIKLSPNISTGISRMD